MGVFAFLEPSGVEKACAIVSAFALPANRELGQERGGFRLLFRPHFGLGFDFVLACLCTIGPINKAYLSNEGRIPSA